MREARAILLALGVNLETEIEPSRELRTKPEELLPLMSSLKALGDFSLFDIVAVDRPEGFDLAYRLLDRGGEGMVGFFTIRVGADRSQPTLPSLIGVWKAADVLELEVWDLMGVGFEGRGVLRRILCKDDFEGHPLRKDFIVTRRQRFAEKAEGAGQ